MLVEGTHATVEEGGLSPCGHISPATAPLMTAAAPKPMVSPIASLRRSSTADCPVQVSPSAIALLQMSS